MIFDLTWLDDNVKFLKPMYIFSHNIFGDATLYYKVCTSQTNLKLNHIFHAVQLFTLVYVQGKKCQLIQMQGGNWDKTNYHFSSLGRKILSLFFGWSHMQAWSRKKQGSAVRNWKREWHHENIKAYYCLSQFLIQERGESVPPEKYVK